MKTLTDRQLQEMYSQNFPGEKPFHKGDLVNWPWHADYLIDILNGEYDLNEARKDLLSFRGRKNKC